MLKSNRRPASAKVNGMPRSAIREIMELASKQTGVIHLEVGEPDFATPMHIIESACKDIREGWTRYTGNAGIPALRAAIADRVANRAGVECKSDRVVVTTGAVGALFTAVTAVVDAGDEVLIPDPGWPNYESIVYLAGAVPVRYELSPELGFVPQLESLEQQIGPKTKALLINSPSNPTGAVFSRSIMEGLGRLAEKHGIYIISDEIYEDIIFRGEHHSALSLGIGDRVFLVSGVSKSYAMTGWRIGYLVCPPDLTDAASKLQEPITSCASAVSQRAALHALTGPQECVGKAREIFQRRRDLVVEILGGANLLAAVPDGAFYALVKIGDRFGTSMEFAKAFLIDENVATVPGITFGPSIEKFVRIAFTTDDGALVEGLQRLRNFIR